jgi:hypothetical protein
MGTEEEKAYMAKSLKFINSYKKNFSPLLSSIASKMNQDENLIEAMNIMKTKHDSNLKELITKLSEKKLIKGDYILTDHDGDFAKYVEQCLRIILIERSKKSMYNLFYLLMQDLKLSENKTLMEAVNVFKEKNKDWKKMVGMLIPPDAQVKILVDLVEPSTRYLIFGNNNKWRPLTSREVIGTVVKRAKVYTKHGDGARINQITTRFKKVVRLPKNIIEEANVDEEVILNPEHIELYKPKAETQGKEALEEEASKSQQPEAGEVERRNDINRSRGFTTGPINQQSVTKPTDHNDINPELKKGGQQRTTRKHKSSIIGGARKTRTYR